LPKEVERSGKDGEIGVNAKLDPYGTHPEKACGDKGNDL